MALDENPIVWIGAFALVMFLMFYAIPVGVCMVFEHDDDSRTEVVNKTTGEVINKFVSEAGNHIVLKSNIFKVSDEDYASVEVGDVVEIANKVDITDNINSPYDDVSETYSEISQRFKLNGVK